MAGTKPGPAKIQLDIGEVERLAAQGLTQTEICLCLGISEDTLGRRKQESAELAEAIKRGKAKAASVIADKLFQMAKDGDLGAIVWYEKTRHGRTDKVQQTTTNITIDWTQVPADIRDAFIDGKMTLDDVLRSIRAN